MFYSSFFKVKCLVARYFSVFAVYLSYFTFIIWWSSEARSHRVYTVKKGYSFSSPQLDVTNQTLTGWELLTNSRTGRVWLVTSQLGTGKAITFSLQCRDWQAFYPAVRIRSSHGPLTHKRLLLPPLGPRGETPSLVGAGGGGTQFRRWDRHSDNLGIL